jgi:hypothetical protein
MKRTIFIVSVLFCVVGITRADDIILTGSSIYYANQAVTRSTKDGKVTGVRVLKGVSEELDAEAVKVISASPKWKPGKVSGNKVRSSISLPVEFRLEKKSNKPSFGIKK